MRPVYLKFKGLNSYIGEQKINFEKLTDKGLFGIFGPTGSGKSTLLDAITIGLYGDISRKSKECINTNCDELYVSFRFRLKSREGIVEYTAERSLKREKNGGIRTKQARLIKHLHSHDEIIAEKPSEMKEEIIQLLGLTMDDFTRSVVLPQGKFGEFLQLTGKDRRVMLERIFNLGKYGRGLMDRLKVHYNQEKNKQNYLEGQLNRYEGISKKGLQLLEEEKKLVEKEYEKTRVDLDKTNSAYDDYKQIWELQTELHQEEKKLEQLLEQKDAMEQLKDRVSLGEKAEIILPYMNKIKKYEKDVQELKDRLKELNDKLETIVSKKKMYEEKLVHVEKFEQEDLPKWHEEVGALKEAIQLLDKEAELRSGMTDLKNKIKTLDEAIAKKQREQEKIEEEVKKINKETEETLQQEKVLYIHPEYRGLIERGVQLEREYKQKRTSIQQLEEEGKFLKEEIVKYTHLKDGHEEESIQYIKAIEEYKDKIKKLIKNTPGDLEDLTELQEDIMSLRSNYQTFMANQEQLKSIEDKRIIIEDKMKQHQSSSTCHHEKLERYNIQIHELMEVMEEHHKNYLAASLAEELVEGTPCPVCGSTEHRLKASIVTDQEGIRGLKQQKEKLQDERESLIKEIQDLQVVMLACEKERKALSDEKEDLLTALKDNTNPKDKLNEKIVQFNDLKVNMGKFKEQKEQLEKTLAKVTEDYNEKKQLTTKYNENLIMYRQRMEELKNKRLTEERKIDELTSSLKECMKNASVEDFEDEKEKVLQKEKILNELYIKKEKLQAYSTQLAKDSGDYNKILKDFEIKRETSLNTLDMNEKQRLAILNQINERSNGKEPVKALSQLQDNIVKYQEGAKKVKESYRYYGEKEREFMIIKAKKEQAFDETTELIQDLKEEKTTLLNRHSFINDEDVLSHVMNMETLKKAQEDIEDYEDKFRHSMGYVKQLKEKLGNKSITEEVYHETQQKKLLLQGKKEDYIKQLTEKDTKIADMKKALLEASDLVKEKETVDKKLGMLEDLTKLVKGNKFIEYVSKNQFRYVVNEASLRLHQLTGRYGIELDDNGEFLVRDDKNGGVLREAATLSGGETFLTSLALALALSSHIQLKGSYPLEFFFLDEGFGTLDTELLDVVMDSLEKLQNQKMTVGIISHVEELKNRVPVKLLVQPSDEEGSTIRLEYT